MKDEVRKVKALCGSSTQIETNYWGRRRKGWPEEDIWWYKERNPYKKRMESTQKQERKLRGMWPGQETFLRAVLCDWAGRQGTSETGCMYKWDRMWDTFPHCSLSKHLNFTASNGFALSGEPWVSHPTGGGGNSHSPAQMQWGVLWHHHGTAKESVSRWGRISLQALHGHCTSYCSAVCSTWMWCHAAPQRVIPSTVAVLWHHLKPRIQVVFSTNDASDALLHFPPNSV